MRQSRSVSPNTVLRVGHGETVTVSGPQHHAQSGAWRDSHSQWASTPCSEWGTARRSRSVGPNIVLRVGTARRLQSVGPNTVLRVGHGETVTVSGPQHRAQSGARWDSHGQWASTTCSEWGTSRQSQFSLLGQRYLSFIQCSYRLFTAVCSLLPCAVVRYCVLFYFISFPCPPPNGVVDEF